MKLTRQEFSNTLLLQIQDSQIVLSIAAGQKILDQEIHQIPNYTNTIALKQQLKTIFKKFKKQYASGYAIFVEIHTNKHNFIPSALFDEKKSEYYSKFQFKKTATENISVQKIEKHRIIHISLIENSITETLYDFFTENISIQHTHAIWLDEILTTYTDTIARKKEESKKTPALQTTSITLHLAITPKTKKKKTAIFLKFSLIVIKLILI